MDKLPTEIYRWFIIFCGNDYQFHLEKGQVAFAYTIVNWDY